MGRYKMTCDLGDESSYSITIHDGDKWATATFTQQTGSYEANDEHLLFFLIQKVSDHNQGQPTTPNTLRAVREELVV